MQTLTLEGRMLEVVTWIMQRHNIIVIIQNRPIHIKLIIILNIKEDLTDHTQAIVLVWLQLEGQELWEHIAVLQNINYIYLMKLLTSISLALFIFSCAPSEKAKNTIPYKYRTKAQVDAACKAQIEENKNSKAQADSNAGNFLLGVMMAMQEDWACDPYR